MTPQVKQQKLLRILQTCGSQQSEAAAYLAVKFIRDLVPVVWFWPRGTSTLRLPYADFREGRRDRVKAGELVKGLRVNASQMCEWQLLRKGKLGAVIGDWLVILPANVAEPLW